VSEQDNGAQAAVTFWRNIALTLLAFLLGNGIGFLTFGFHTASKDDLERVMVTLNTRLVGLEERESVREKQMSNLIGQLQARHLANAPPP